MKRDDLLIFINEFKTSLRSLKLDGMETTNKIDLLSPKKGFFSFLYPIHKKVDELSSLGGIITGSRALSLYRFNGNPLIYRKSDDWDILIQKEKLIKFCSDNRIVPSGDKPWISIEYKMDRILLNLKTGRFTRKGVYSGTSSMFSHDLDIIGLDEVTTSYNEINGYKIDKLENILTFKLNLIESEINSKPIYRSEDSKHVNDLICIMNVLRTHSK